MNEPSCKLILEPTNDRMNDQTTHGMNEQTEVPLQQSDTHANVIQQLVPAANSEEAKVASKTAHQLPTCSHSTNNLWQCQSFVDNVSINSWQCRMEIDKVKSMKTCCKPSDQPRDAARWEECLDLDEKSLTTFCHCDGG